MTETNPTTSGMTISQDPKSDSNLTLGSDFGKHDDSIVPHKISDHNMAVQVSVWADGKWININDTLDQMNLGMDLNKVAKVVEAQVAKIADVESSANNAVKQAESAREASNTNKAAIANMDSAVKATQQEVSNAVANVNDANKNITKINTDLKAIQADIAGQSVAVGTIQADLSAAKQQIKDAEGNITAVNQTARSAYSIASDANSNAVEVKQTAQSAYAVANDAKSNITQVKVTADSAMTLATNAKSDAAEAKVTANGISTTVTGISSQVQSLSDATKAVSDNMKNKADKGTVDQVVSKLTTSINQAKDALTSKADKLDIDKLNKTVTDTQTLLNQKAGELSSTITQVSNKAGQNTTLISNLTQTVDGMQSTVKNKADQSTVSQLANQMLAKVSTKDFQAEIALMQKNLNLRISKGDLISQLNLEAGGNGLIQVANGKGKLYLDADSVVFSKKAFIPSAAITDIEADKIKSGTLDAGLMRVINLTADTIHGGTLDVGSMNVKNLSANDITTGTLTGIDISASDSLGNLFDMQGSKIKWFSKGFEVDKKGKPDDNGIHGVITVASQSSYDFYQGPNTTPYRDTIHFATDKDFWFTTGTDYEPDKDAYDSGIYAEFGMLGKSESDGNSPVGFYANTDRNTFSILSAVNGISPPPSGFGVEFNTINGMVVNLRPDNWKNNPGTGDKHWGYGNQSFNIQKDDHIGAYFGQGDNGNQINFNLGGDGCGFNVNGPFHVTGAKNSVVQTSQGWLAINAYETAEYYFGDIGESNTGNQSKVTIGIDKIFNETVNTNVQYQVFVTPYSDAHIWVEQRYHNRFIICSDKPNAEFGWEIKAKRKGYEDHRLRKVNADFKPLSVLNKGDF